MERYQVYFKAELFEDAKQYADGWYGVGYDRREDAFEMYDWCRANEIEVELHDNEYDVTFVNDEWY